MVKLPRNAGREVVFLWCTDGTARRSKSYANGFGTSPLRPTETFWTGTVNDEQVLGSEEMKLYTLPMRFSPFGWLKRRKKLQLADDFRMQERDAQADRFYREILLPDEEPGFVSDEATLRDLSLAPDDELIRRVKEHYGTTLSMGDFRKPFWSLLDDLELGSSVDDPASGSVPLA